jgi:hypothetical protein
MCAQLDLEVMHKRPKKKSKHCKIYINFGLKIFFFFFFFFFETKGCMAPCITERKLYFLNVIYPRSLGMRSSNFLGLISKTVTSKNDIYFV